jgi:2-dehydro-3-deoxygluconokinase
LTAGADPRGGGGADTDHDLVAIGEPLIEFNQRRPGDEDYRCGFGGDTSNAVIAAARSGARTAYVTRVGADPFGRALLALWAREGVDARHVVVDESAPTGMYFVSHGEAGHEFSYLRAGSAASRLQAADVPRAVLARARFVLASGISLAISTQACDAVLAALAAARADGVRVALDLNLRLRLWPLARARALLREALTLAELVLATDDEMATLFGCADADAACAHLLDAGVGVALVKRGAQGLLLHDGRERIDLPGHPVAAVDATGAGDALCGALLARLAAGDDLPTAAAYANAAAALSTTGYGAVAPLPTPAQVHALLAAQAAAPLR